MAFDVALDLLLVVQQVAQELEDLADRADVEPSARSLG